MIPGGSGMNTLQECRDAAREHHPDANGFSFGAGLSIKFSHKNMEN